MNAWRLSFMIISVLGGHLLAADSEADQNPVRLSWFPRFSPDSKLLATAHGSWDKAEAGEVRIWDAKTGDKKYAIKHDRGVRTVAWSPTGDFFAAGDYGGMVRVYDTKTGKKTDETKYSGQVEVLLIAPDGKHLITGHGGGSVRVTELATKKRVRNFDQIHEGGIWGMTLSPDGSLVATAGRDGFVRILQLANSLVLHELKHPAATNGVAFTPDGKFLFTGCQDAKIRVFEVEKGSEVRTLEGHESGSVTDLQFSTSGKILASSGMDHTVRIWDLSDFEHPALKSTLDVHNEFVFGVAISANGELMASAGWDDQVVVWNAATDEEIWSWTR